MNYDVRNLGPCLGQAQKRGEMKPLHRIPNPAPLDDWISNSNTDIN